MPEVAPLQSGDPAAIGGYRLTGRIGEGGQGVVYLGTGPNLETVAVKLLSANLDGMARQRFVREAAATKRVARFCTVQVLDADLEGDRPYIVSEYIPGPSLAEHVTADGVMSGGALERLAIGTLTALSAIHTAGVIHRDFKPHNVILGPDGPRVIDFGIAKALDTSSSTMPSGVIGTPAYMAPEQIRGMALGTPADIWAWASTIVFAATGVPPFGTDSIPTVVGRILHADPNLGGLAEPVRELVAVALTKDPAYRPTAQDLLMRLLGGPAAVPAAPAPGMPPTALLAAGEQRAGADAATTERYSAQIPAAWDGSERPFVPQQTGSRHALPTMAVPRRNPGFRPGIAMLSAILAAVLVAGGAALAIYLTGKKAPNDLVADPLPTTSSEVGTPPSSSDPGPTPTPTPSKSSAAPPPSTSPPPQHATLICTDQSPFTIPPGETGGIGFKSVDGPLGWTATLSDGGILSSTTGTTASGVNSYIKFSLTDAQRAAGGESTITVTAKNSDVCSRKMIWEPTPTDPPTSDPPTPTATPPAD